MSFEKEELGHKPKNAVVSRSCEWFTIYSKQENGLDPPTAKQIVNSANNVNKKENGSFPGASRN